MMTIFILLSIYIVSCVLYYYLIRAAHFGKNKIYLMKPNVTDLITMFVPVLNSFMCMVISFNIIDNKTTRFFNSKK